MTTDRILQVVTRSEWGGAPRIVESLATQLDDVTDVACGPGGRLIDQLESAGVTVHVQPHLQSSPGPADILAYRDLRTLIDEEGFDLVHSHSTKAGALARIAAGRVGIPSVFTVHGWGFYNTEYGLLRPLLVGGERFLARRTDEVVCVSHNDYREGRARGILSNERGTVIHNGIEPLEFGSDRQTVYDAFDVDPDTPVIGAIGRLAPQKDPLAILETARQLERRGLDVTTILVGSGPLTEECHDFVEEHGMTDVYLPGFVEEALQFLPDFDVFLLPSRFEGFPLTVLECLHAGVPIVAHAVGGVPEAIDDGKTGVLVSPDASSSRFAEHVASLLENPRRRRAMGRRAQQVAANRFTRDRMVREYRDLYRSLLD